MANDFLTNLRASRSGSQSSTSSKLPTRGDMQKERQNNVNPISFIDLLRSALGVSDTTKKQLNLRDVPPSNIDKMSPEDSARASEQEGLNWNNADNGTLYTEEIVNNQLGAEKGTLYQNQDLQRYMTKDIFDNYDYLNSVLDKYDAAKTWVDKYKVIENTAKSFKNMPSSIYKWLDELNYQTAMGRNYGDTDPKDISNHMRQINETVKRSMSPKRI